MLKRTMLFSLALLVSASAVAQTSSTTKRQVDSTYKAPLVTSQAIGSPSNSAEEKATVVATGGNTVTRTFTNFDLCLVSGVRGRLSSSSTDGANTPYPDCNVQRDATVTTTWIGKAVSRQIGTSSAYIETYCDVACYRSVESAAASTSTGAYTSLATPPASVLCATPDTYGTSPCVFTLPDSNEGSSYNNSFQAQGAASAWFNCAISATCPAGGGTWSVGSYTRQRNTQMCGEYAGAGDGCID